MPSYNNEDLILSFEGKVIARIHVSSGNLTLGGEGRDGDIFLRDKDGNTQIELNADKGQLFLGARGHDGNLIIRDKVGRDTIFINGDPGRIDVGVDGQDGDIRVRDSAGRDTVRINGEKGQLFLGTDGHDGNLIVRDRNGQNTVFINGDAGDITLLNADFAEDFDLADKVEAVPGTVMCIGPDGGLELCDTYADPRAVGVVSGAGGTRPGLVLDHSAEQTGRAPIALIGKVGVFVDQVASDLAPGDFLTSSKRLGYATRAEPDTPPEAILGRMLRSFSEDMVIMLVRK